MLSGGYVLQPSCWYAFNILPMIEMQALPIFLDRLVDPVTAVVLSVTVVLFFGKPSSLMLCCQMH